MNRAAVTVLAVVAACSGHSSRPTTPEPAPIERTITVAPGEFAELNLELPAASTVSVRFHADAPLEWNVHSHPSGEVKIHDSGSAADAEVPFTTTGADVYSYLWENHGDVAVTLHVELSLPAAGRVHSWHPEESSGGAACTDRRGGSLITILINDQTFTFWSTAPDFIAKAKELLASKKSHNAMFSKLVDGRDCDDQWTFHVDPADMTWPDMTIELCDGRPADIEGNKPYWFETVTRWCPWGAKVTAVIDAP